MSDLCAIAEKAGWPTRSLLSGEPFGVIEVKQDDLAAPLKEKLLALSQHKLSFGDLSRGGFLHHEEGGRGRPEPD